MGAARVFIELSEQWKAAGHQVEKFCLTDAFPRQTDSSWLSALREISFPARAAQHVRRVASQFDVIDALMGTLPLSKGSLGFSGLFVSRSIGLYRAYDDFVRFSRKRWPDRPRGKLLGRYFYRIKRASLARKSHQSILHSDLVNVPNDDERELLPQKNVLVEPYGLDKNVALAFAGAALPTERRLSNKEFCFVGMWGLRKGAGDWGEIFNRIREQIPDARFKFLGTMADEHTVLRDLPVSRSGSVEVISMFNPEDLPKLIGSCAVGIFPSYIEGFGIALLEQLAAGIPTVAYDVPGPRQILEPLKKLLLVPAGNSGAMAERAIELLNMTPANYDVLSAQCREIAGQFRWEQIASSTAEHYRAALQKLGREK